MPIFPSKKSSPLRSRLAECITARQDAYARVAGIQSSLARLADHEAAVAEAERSLAELDAAEASATLAWAKSGDGTAPAPNVESRESISKALATARAQAKAAAGARASLSAEEAAEASKLPAIESWTRSTIAMIVLEEAESLLPELIEAQRQVSARKERLAQIAKFVLAAADAARESGDAGSREIFVEQEHFHQNLQRAAAHHDAPLDAVAASHQALMSFVAALRDDAGVSMAVQA
jgi:hypothetical protein